ncbi:hypothetical protein H0H92_003592 [Tricholoma furcatifolium]|nr:hypothetical protein H0H92_003592 [Tricholoma furcatifolium]
MVKTLTAPRTQVLSTLKKDDTVDAIPLAFLDVFFSTGGLPEIDLADTCNNLNGNIFPGTKLAMCPDLGNDIKACQARGKIVTISLGGAAGSSTLSSDAPGQAFAQTIWNLFLGGSSNTRPFGDAVLDGVDLDVESGNGKGLAAFVTELRQLAQGANKRYYVTAAPQCPFPDANIGSVINAVGFDALYVQDWNFGVWDNWAKNRSPNKDVKIYIGAPASSSAAGSGYVDAGTLSQIVQATRSQYSSFGGVMLWDMSQAIGEFSPAFFHHKACAGNNQYNVAIKNALMNGASATTTTIQATTTTSSTTSTTATTPQATTSTTDPMTSTTSTTDTSTTSTTSTTPATTVETSPPASSSCAGVLDWDPSTAYVGGYNVVYNGELWSAKWWSIGDTPGGDVGVWANMGPCPDSDASPLLTSIPTNEACTGIATWLPHIIIPLSRIPRVFGSITALALLVRIPGGATHDYSDGTEQYRLGASHMQYMCKALPSRFARSLGSD